MVLDRLLRASVLIVVIAFLATQFEAGTFKFDSFGRKAQPTPWSSVDTWKRGCENTKSGPCTAVPKVSWEDIPANENETVAKVIASTERPIVLINTPADEWTTIHEVLGSAAAFGELIGPKATLSHVYRAGDKNVLYHNPAMPLSKSNLLSWQPKFTHADLSVEDFISQVQNRSKSTLYYYYSGNVLLDDCLKTLKHVLPVVEPFSLQHPQQQKNSTQVHVWVGGENITTLTHYDTYHNFYIQLSGQKEFTLYPPSEWKNLHLFPSLHPSARQSQFGSNEYSFLENTNTSVVPLEEFPRAHKLREPLKVILNPGEVLYLPPYWFHRVRSIGESLSLNVWTDSVFGINETEELLGNAVPFATDKRWSNFATDVAVLRMVVSLSKLLPQAKEVVIGILESQYAPLQVFPQNVNLDATTILHGLTCPEIWSKVSGLPPALQSQVDEQVAYLHEVLGIFSGDGMRALAYSNFIQGVANWSSRNPDKVTVYLECVRSLLDEGLDMEQ